MSGAIGIVQSLKPRNFAAKKKGFTFVDFLQHHTTAEHGRIQHNTVTIKRESGIWTLLQKREEYNTKKSFHVDSR